MKEGVSMRRSIMNFWLNIIIFIVFIGMTFTGVLLLGVPYGFGGTILGLARYDWGDLHWVLSLLFVVLTIIHLALHWSWTTASFKKRVGVGPKALAIVLLAMVLIFCIIAPIYLTKDFPGRKEFKQAQHRGLNEIDGDIAKNSASVAASPDAGPSGKSRKLVEVTALRDEKMETDTS
jgi:hypothetical protein